MSSLETLMTAKAALEAGLIEQADFDAVKAAFLKAQSLKAGLDAGVMSASDVEEARGAFLESLDLQGGGSGGGGGARGSRTVSVDGDNGSNANVASCSSRQATAAATPAPRHPAATSSGGILGFLPGARKAAPAAAAAPAAPPPPPPPPPPTTTSVARSAPAPPPPPPPPAPAPPRPAANGATKSSAAPLPDIPGVSIPSNVPKMGGSRPKQGAATSMSGVSVTDDAVNLFYHMKAKSSYKWVIWRVDEALGAVVVAAAGDAGGKTTLSDLLSLLPENDCRFACYDHEHLNSEGRVFNKIIFISWAPDDAPVKSKMVSASTKDFFKGHLDGIGVELQASEKEELAEPVIAEAVRATITRK